MDFEHPAPPHSLFQSLLCTLTGVQWALLKVQRALLKVLSKGQTARFPALLTPFTDRTEMTKPPGRAPERSKPLPHGEGQPLLSNWSLQTTTIISTICDEAYGRSLGNSGAKLHAHARKEVYIMCMCHVLRTLFYASCFGLNGVFEPFLHSWAHACILGMM